MSNAELIKEAAKIAKDNRNYRMRFFPSRVLNELIAALVAAEAERDAALDEAACIADGFGIIGARPTDDDYWGGHNDASVKIAAAIRALAVAQGATS